MKNKGKQKNRNTKKFITKVKMLNKINKTKGNIQ